jgi:hypothetical protein
MRTFQDIETAKEMQNMRGYSERVVANDHERSREGGPPVGVIFAWDRFSVSSGLKNTACVASKRRPLAWHGNACGNVASGQNCSE